jgi:hypothetical protein
MHESKTKSGDCMANQTKHFSRQLPWNSTQSRRKPCGQVKPWERQVRAFCENSVASPSLSSLSFST